MLLKYVYVVFIGVLLSLFIGVGIAAFYPGPKAPEANYYPAKNFYNTPPSATEAAELRKEDMKQQKIWTDFQKETEEYNKNVSIIAVVLSVIILIISFVLSKKLLFIADGLLLGGLLTLIYSIIRSFNSRDFKFMFVVVTVGLLVAIFLGYTKFIKPAKK